MQTAWFGSPGAPRELKNRVPGVPGSSKNGILQSAKKCSGEARGPQSIVKHNIFATWISKIELTLTFWRRKPNPRRQNAEVLACFRSWVLAVVNSPLTVQIQVAKKGTLRAPALSLTNDIRHIRGIRGNDVRAWPSEPDFSRRGARMTVVANAQTPSNYILS